MYLSKEDGATETLTSHGGLWSRYRLGEPFKIVYLAKDPRNIDAEANEGVVSGTSPHFVGAMGGEIIVKMAWSFTHQWIGTWLKPGYSFVTPKGMYHWHLNHRPKPIAAQVFTPPEIPNEQNHFVVSAKVKYFKYGRS